jgi:hypothetical protein
MRKVNADFLVDTMAFAAFVLLAASGVLLRYLLPPGSGHFNALWGMDRHEWGRIHFWIAVAMTGALALHLVLHWRWIVSVVKGRPRDASGMRVALAIVGLLALAGLAAAPFFADIEQTGEPPHRMRSDQPASPAYEINGSMTLRQVEQETGVPASVILEQLGLPPDVSVDETLGRLRRQYGFEMNDVRRIVQEHIQLSGSAEP